MSLNILAPEAIDTGSVLHISGVQKRIITVFLRGRLDKLF